MYESQDKMVSHPIHYQSSKGLEVIDVIEAFTDGLTGIEATDTGNIIKYACRWKGKNGIQDLEKIMWYTQHLIDHLKQKQEVKNKTRIQVLNDRYVVIFTDRLMADDFVKTAKNMFEMYETLLVSDIYDLVGLTDENAYSLSTIGWIKTSGELDIQPVEIHECEWYVGFPTHIRLEKEND